MLSFDLLSAIRDFVSLGLVLCNRFLPARGANMSLTKSHKFSAGIRSKLRPVSDDVRVQDDSMTALVSENSLMR